MEFPKDVTIERDIITKNPKNGLPLLYIGHEIRKITNL
jgi:hypothetical protein